MKGKLVWLLLACLMVSILVLTSCAGNSAKEIAEKFVEAENEAWNTGNVDALDEVEDPDIVIHMMGASDMVGREAHKQFIAGARRSFSNPQHEFLDITGTGDIAAFRYTERFTFAGKEVYYQGAMFLHTKNGKIVEIYMVWDTMSLNQGLGLVPASSQ